MSDASSAVTYTSVYTDSEPWRYYEEESAESGSLGVIVYGYDGLPMPPVAPPSPDYVPGPEHPPTPDYVPSPEHPPSSIEIPYVPELEYLEYLAPSDDEAPLEDQSLPADASYTAASPGYVADSDPNEDPEEDPEDDQADYPADGGIGGALAPADSSAVPIVDPILLAGDTEALEADEPTPTPRSPHTITPLSQTRLRRAQKTVRPELPTSASMEACIARHATLLSPPLLVPSLPLPLPSPFTTSLNDTAAPLGHRAAEIRMRALLPSTSRRTDILEADVPPQKKVCLTTPALGFEVRKSSAAGAARQQGPTESDLKRYMDDRALLRARVNTLFRDRPNHRHTAMLLDREAMYAREAWAGSGDTSAAIAAHKMAPKKRTTRAKPATTTTPTITVTDAQLQALMDRGVAAALAERDADRSRNADNSNAAL
nr:hypothetical protein [Tanacetum cinerariifolium]